MSIYRRQADTIEACTKDLITFINSALMELGVVEFNVRQRRDDLRTLKKPYTASIYSQATAVSQRSVALSVSHRSIASSPSQKSQASAESEKSKVQSVSQRSIASSLSQKSQASTESKNSQASNSIQHSITSEARAPSMSEQLAQAEADLAAGHARLQALAKQEDDRKKLAKLEEERRKMDYSIAEQRRKLKMLKAESEINVGSAKIKALQAAIIPPSSTINSAINHQPFANPHKTQEQFVGLQPVKSPSIYPLNPDAPTFNPATTTRTAYQDTQDHQRDSFLATSIANAMDRNRLPVPTPKPFSGDPMEYISFKRSFKTLIEEKAISAEEKIYYLQQYLQGDAKQAVAGCFYGTQESDYHQAWQTLEKRFGHSFRIQESFREKLEDWPKLNIKDCTGLQRYADVLKSCLDAMPHINGLQVLNDCKENRRVCSDHLSAAFMCLLRKASSRAFMVSCHVGCG